MSCTNKFSISFRCIFLLLLLLLLLPLFRFRFYFYFAEYVWVRFGSNELRNFATRENIMIFQWELDYREIKSRVFEQRKVLRKT